MPVEDKARVAYLCDGCGEYADQAADVKHKDDCKMKLGGIKKACTKSGHTPHTAGK